MPVLALKMQEGEKRRCEEGQEGSFAAPRHPSASGNTSHRSSERCSGSSRSSSRSTGGSQGEMPAELVQAAVPARELLKLRWSEPTAVNRPGLGRSASLGRSHSPPAIEGNAYAHQGLCIRPMHGPQGRHSWHGGMQAQRSSAPQLSVGLSLQCVTPQRCWVHSSSLPFPHAQSRSRLCMTSYPNSLGGHKPSDLDALPEEGSSEEAEGEGAGASLRPCPVAYPPAPKSAPLMPHRTSPSPSTCVCDGTEHGDFLDGHLESNAMDSGPRQVLALRLTGRVPARLPTPNAAAITDACLGPDAGTETLGGEQQLQATPPTPVQHTSDNHPRLSVASLSVSLGEQGMAGVLDLLAACSGEAENGLA